ncbi:MAG: STAS/SEC14 domain-containing protein [Deltaproteobacteria bacterium]|nr:STAS/SEC14 domain-containing protein [Deltaproteobacteria bacterium]
MTDPSGKRSSSPAELRPQSAPVVMMRLVGFLDAEQVRKATTTASEQLDRLGLGRLLVDCSRMDDYEGEARRLFTEWNAKNKHRVQGVAVVTDKLLWHMVVSTIGLASSQTMKAFSDIDEAYGWLAGLTTSKRR